MSWLMVTHFASVFTNLGRPRIGMKLTLCRGHECSRFLNSRLTLLQCNKKFLRTLRFSL